MRAVSANHERGGRVRHTSADVPAVELARLDEERGRVAGGLRGGTGDEGLEDGEDGMIVAVGVRELGAQCPARHIAHNALLLRDERR